MSPGGNGIFRPAIILISRARSFEAISFADLRALADAYDLLRLVIETRKDQIERMNWAIRAKSGATVDPAQIAKRREILRNGPMARMTGPPGCA